MNRNRTHNPRAFTLLELMISIALVLILMLGINQVFKVTGEAVGTSQAVSDGVRAARAVQTTFGNDLKTIVTTDAPFMIIRSQRIAAFRNREDEAGDRDYVPAPGATAAPIDQAMRSFDYDGDGAENAAAAVGNFDLIPRAILGRRNFRVDQFSFFCTGRFPRQTGNDGTYAADMSSNEAWVWYGHLKMPDATGALDMHRDPGAFPTFGTPVSAQSNPNNFYASQWMLGRFAMLLREPRPNGEIWDENDVPQQHVPRDPTDTLLEPLGQQSRSTGTGTNQFQVQWGRYDLAGTTMALFTPILTDIIMNPVPAIPKFYEGNFGLSYRFQANPYPPKPLTSLEMARTVPILLPSCSQFIVEFAGDFVQQSQGPPYHPTPAGELFDTDGDPAASAIGSDGHTDFIVRNPGTPNETRTIRWYGFPRDVDSNTPGSEGKPDGRIPGLLSPGVTNNTMPDVVPVRDVIGTFPADAGKSMAFERDIHAGAPQMKLAPKADYGVDAPVVGIALDAEYICAWQPTGTYQDPLTGTPVPDPPHPQMIRITIMLDDPSGRIAEGRTFEYVFRVGG